MMDMYEICGCCPEAPDRKNTSDASLMGAKKTGTYLVDNRLKTHLTRSVAALIWYSTVLDRSGHPADILIVIRVIVAGVPEPLGDCAGLLDVDSQIREQLGVTSNGSTSASGPEQRHWSRRCVRVYGFDT